MSLPLFSAYRLRRKKVHLGRFVSPREFSSINFTFFGLRRLNLEKESESIVNLFSDSLKLKRLSSDLVFITLVKMVLNRRLFGANLSIFRTD
jgi:hypothetical protein